MIIAETDESDGSIALYHPKIAVLTNISEDHKGMDELLPLFRQFLNQSDIQVLNMDCPHVTALAGDYPNAIHYSLQNDGDDLNLKVPGKHNRSNALAALACLEALYSNFDKPKAFEVLHIFKGVGSRLEFIGEKKGITVIDDFGHNPDKIAAGIKTLKEEWRRLLLIYQSHGYKPMAMHAEALKQVLKKNLADGDIFYMPDIVYFGGRIKKTITAESFIAQLQKENLNALYYPTLSEIKNDVLNKVQKSDIICVMGARDNALRELAHEIYKEL
jgi:UDP-N-acetylmuramate--alanine ligase